MNEKKVTPIIWLVTFTMLVSMLPFLSEALPMEQNKPEKALRLTIKYQKGEMNLLKVEPLQMIIPLTVKEQVFKGEADRGEYFFEVSDDKKNVVLRSNMENPTVTLMEYEDPEHPGKIRSKLVKHKEMTFSIIIPAPDNARFIRFSRVAPGQESIAPKMRKYEDLGTFDLLTVQKETSK
jgi:hypothetical protein